MFSRIVEIFSLIRRCKRDWPNHVKTGGVGHGSVMVKYHTFQTRGQGFEPLCKHFFSQFSMGPKPYVALPLGVGAFPHGMDLSIWVFSYYQHSRVMSLKICYL